jgi:AGCS family alanine or glycine:cation symporter
MTSLSATIGTGNIAGVATAISIGGPGALFWMWCTALVGMATKYAEAVCAVKYREVDEEGNYSGGPMYYIKNGLGKNWHWLAWLFALFGALAGFGIGNTVQADSVADALHTAFAIPEKTTSVVIAIFVGLVILGGIKRIAHVAGVLVPFMATAYLRAGLVIVALNIQQLPAVIALVIDSAFTGSAATGGFAGAGIMLAIQWGVARGIFSNEAGLGSAPIAHAAARTDDPVRQGMIAMLGTFIDTLVICSVTGFVILLSGVWTTGVGGAGLSTQAFGSIIPHGEFIVSIGLSVFAFTTLLGWSYYSERCVTYLMGAKAVLPFRLLWVGAILLPAFAEWNLKFVWLLADTLNAFMAIPNLIALLLLSPVVFGLTKQALKIK